MKFVLNDVAEVQTFFSFLLDMIFSGSKTGDGRRMGRVFIDWDWYVVDVTCG